MAYTETPTGAASTDPAAGCGHTGPASMERVRYFARQLIGPDDLTQEQDYFRARMRRHNRLLHGWGVACGCLVKPGDRDWTVTVEPGYVLGPQGDEILIDESITVDISLQDSDGNNVSACGGNAGLDPWCASIRTGVQPNQTVYVAVAYAQCNARPVRVQPVGCGCDGAQCEYSRVRDSYVVRALAALPRSYSNMQTVGSPFSCPTVGVRECPDCVDEPWVVLAKVTPSSKQIKPSDIDNNGLRRYVASFGDWWLNCAGVGNALLKVRGVRLLDSGNKPPEDPGAREVFKVTNPAQPVVIPPDTQSNVLEVQFSEDVPVDFNTVQDGKTFTVTLNVIPPSGPPVPVTQVVPGKIIPMPMPDNAVRWVPKQVQGAPSLMEDLLSAGGVAAGGARAYLTISLKGTGQPAITSEQAQGGRPLDGEPAQAFPSGDDREGGDFNLIVVPGGGQVAPSHTLKVAALRILKVDEGQPDDPNATIIVTVKDPTKLVKVTDQAANCIEVQFSEGVPVNFDTIEDGKTFIVNLTETPDELLQGRIVPMKEANAVRWVRKVQQKPLTVTLKGDGDAVITSTQEDGRQVLDGNRHATFPSGDDQPGGDFTFNLLVSNQ